MTEIELKPKSYDELSRTLIEATTDNLFLEDENKHLKSIIKEVREYIESEKYVDDTDIDKYHKFIEILDKENK